MRRFYLVFLFFLLSLFLSRTAMGAAFQFYELGTPVIGIAGVGQAVLAEDASTSYFNPAGMTLLPGNAFMLGTQMNLFYANFSPNTSTTLSGDNGGSAGSLIPGFDAYVVFQLSPSIRAGVSVTSPYGGALNYNNHWVGRYYVQQILFYTVNVNPSLAFQVNDWLSIGGGIAIEYANLYQTLAAPITATVDGQATLKLDNTSPGFNLGVMLTPRPETRIGIAYRTQIIHHFRGNLSFLNLDFSPSSSTKMVMPAGIIASISHLFPNQFTLLGELGWSNWSSMKDTAVHVANVSAVTPNNWHDTYRLGLGGRYQVLPQLLVQAGASFDSSPTSSSHRLPDLPMDRQFRFGGGLEYALLKPVTLGVSYEYIHLGSASINNTSRFGVLAGSYSRNYANVLQASLNVDC